MQTDYTGSEYRLDDLQTDGLKIFQKPADFCFGTDAVLLADFAAKRIKKRARVIDLCTGNGIIPLLLYSRRKDIDIYAVEINEETAALAEYNMEYNKVTDYIHVVHSDIKTLPNSYKNNYDAVTVNPPYIPVGKGLLSGKEKLSAARHELYADLENIICVSAELLKDKGKFFMVHRASRTAEIIRFMSLYQLEPKALRFVYSNQNGNANLVLTTGAKNSGAWIDILPPLIIYNEDKTNTKEIDEIYRRN